MAVCTPVHVNVEGIPAPCTPPTHPLRSNLSQSPSMAHKAGPMGRLLLQVLLPSLFAGRRSDAPSHNHHPSPPTHVIWRCPNPILEPCESPGAFLAGRVGTSLSKICSAVDQVQDPAGPLQARPGMLLVSILLRITLLLPEATSSCSQNLHCITLCFFQRRSRRLPSRSARTTSLPL